MRLSNYIYSLFVKCFLFLFLICSWNISLLAQVSLTEGGVVVGNHGYETNMMIWFYPTYDIEAGDVIDVFFDSVAEGSPSTHDPLFQLNTSIDFAIEIEDHGVTTAYPVSTTASGSTQFGSFIANGGVDYIRFIVPPSFTTVVANDPAVKMFIYIGAADDDIMYATNSIVSGYTGYSPSASNYILNYPDENGDNSVDVHVDVYEYNSPSSTSHNLTYNIDTVNSGAGGVAYAFDISTDISPYINFNLYTNRMDFGDLVLYKIIRRSISGSISTNAPGGYSLRYRSGEFTTGGSAIDPNTTVSDLIPDGSNEGWGLRFSAYQVDSDSTLVNNYFFAEDTFLVNDNQEFQELCSTDGASLTLFNLEGGVAISTTTSASSYSNIINLNIYASF